MADFKKIYVVNDGPKKESSNAPKTPKVPKTGRGRRRFRRVARLFLVLLVFALGLGVGVLENEQGDELFRDTEVGEFFSNYDPIQFQQPDNSPKPRHSVQGFEDEFIPHWREITRNASFDVTQHFACRRGCRNVSQREILKTLHEGELVEFQEKTNRKKSSVYKVERAGFDRKITICFSIYRTQDRIRLITIWDNRSHNCPDQCDPVKN